MAYPTHPMFTAPRHRADPLARVRGEFEVLVRDNRALRGRVESLEEHVHDLRGELAGYQRSTAALRSQLESERERRRAAEEQLERALRAAADQRGRHRAEEAAEPATEAAQADLEATEARLRSLAADFDNYRRREAERLALERRTEKVQVLGDVLEVVDAVERALALDVDHSSAWYQGNVAIARQMAAVLDRHGLERMGEVGEDFDPTVHEAVALVVSDDLPDGAVAEVVLPGFRFEDGSLLRPARVTVVGRS